jgi:Zn-dependent M16 (insulinase) family peptidase
VGIIHWFVYHSPELLEESLRQDERYDQLLQEPESFWHTLMRKYFFKRPHTAVLGFPSKTKADELENAESSRVAARKVCIVIILWVCISLGGCV